jgi:hypothetical protein
MVCSLLTNPGHHAAWAVHGNCIKHSMLSVKQPSFQIIGGQQFTVRQAPFPSATAGLVLDCAAKCG